MTYKLKFLPAALKEWKKLNPHIQVIFKEKLKARLVNPEIAKDRLYGELSNRYKIKLRQLGYRLVYEVSKKEVLVLIVSVGKRDKFSAYKNAITRISKSH